MSPVNLNRRERPAQDPSLRRKNFDEVALGYALEDAVEEAKRCIQCPKRNCVLGCPVGVLIPEFIKALRDGNLPEAARQLKVKNNLPAIYRRILTLSLMCQLSQVFVARALAHAPRGVRLRRGGEAVAAAFEPVRGGSGGVAIFSV